MTPRFFVEPGSIARRVGETGEPGFTGVVTGDEAHHAARVLRLGPGDPVVLLDGSGDEYWGKVVRVAQGPQGPRVEVAGDAIRRSEAEPPFVLLLVQGLPKGEKLEAIVEKGTEVGVTHFLPVETERSVVRLSEDRAERRRSRCARVAQAAAKQCGRAVAPAILPFATLEEAAAAKELEGLTLIAFWEEATTPLKSIVRRLESEPDGEGVRGFALFIGPEGGFSAREAKLLEGRGAHLASLGPRLLRTETAGPIAAALILYAFGGERAVSPRLA